MPAESTVLVSWAGDRPDYLSLFIPTWTVQVRLFSGLRGDRPSAGLATNGFPDFVSGFLTQLTQSFAIG